MIRPSAQLLLLAGVAFMALGLLLTYLSSRRSDGLRPRARVALESTGMEFAASLSAADSGGGGGESTVQCTTGRELDRVCLFSDVFLWQGRLVFLSRDPNRTAPRVAMDYRPTSGHLWLQPLVQTPEALVAARQAASSVLEWTGPQDEAYIWSGTLYNYGHAVGEYLPSLHNTLCKYLGRCTADNTTGLRLVLNRAGATAWPAYVDEALGCLAGERLVNMADPQLAGTLIAVRRLLVGVGPDCRAANVCQGNPRWKGKRPISKQQYRLYRQRMGECLGFNAGAAAPLAPRPKLLLVDRHFSSGRHMLNVAEVEDSLRRRYGGTVDVEVQYMENRTVAEQARLWSGATIVVHIHGAALGNYAFLPRGAVAIHVSLAHPLGGAAGMGDAFPLEFESDLRGVSNIGVLLLHVPFKLYGQLRVRELERDPLWATLSGAEKAAVQEEGSCRALGPAHPARQGCAMRWLLKGHDLAVPLGALGERVGEALALAHRKQGALWPPPRHGSP